MAVAVFTQVVAEMRQMLTVKRNYCGSYLIPKWTNIKSVVPSECPSITVKLTMLL